MRWAPNSSSASLRRPFTAVCVPTGMNTGVSMTPCGVVRRLRRAPVASVFRTAKEKFTHRVYQEKIQAMPILQATYTAQTESTMLSDFPLSFLGFTAANPIATSNIVQIVKMSMDLAKAITALDVLSGRKAPILVATG